MLDGKHNVSLSLDQEIFILREDISLLDSLFMKYLFEVCEIVLNKLNSRRTRIMPRRYEGCSGSQFVSRAMYNKQLTSMDNLTGMYNVMQQVA